MAWTCSALSNEALVSTLQRKGLVKSSSVANAMAAVDRRWFIPQQYTAAEAYQDCPLPIGFNVTISAPHMHAIMLEILAPFIVRSSEEPNATASKTSLRVLDVGSGSGFLTAVIAEMCHAEAGRRELDWKVVGLEHMRGLKEGAEAAIRQSPLAAHLESGRLQFVVGDGRNPGPSVPAPEEGFDVIHVGAAATEDSVPALTRLLRVDGCLVVPVGEQGSPQRLLVYTKEANGNVSWREDGLCTFVPLTSAAQQIGK